MGPFNSNVISLSRIVNNFKRVPVQAFLRHQLFSRLFRTQAELKVAQMVRCYIYYGTDSLPLLEDMNS